MEYSYKEAILGSGNIFRNKRKITRKYLQNPLEILMKHELNTITHWLDQPCHKKVSHWICKHILLLFLQVHSCDLYDNYKYPLLLVSCISLVRESVANICTFGFIFANHCGGPCGCILKCGGWCIKVI